MKPEDSHDWINDLLERMFKQLPEQTSEPPPLDVVPPTPAEVHALLESASVGAQLLEGGHFVTGPDGEPLGVEPVYRTRTEPVVLHWKDRERLEQALRDHLNQEDQENPDD